MAATKLSKQARVLLDEYVHAVRDHREWNNEHNVGLRSSSISHASNATADARFENRIFA